MSVHQNIPRGAGELRPKPLKPARLKPEMEGRDLAVPCPWCQVRPGHMPCQGHGVRGSPSPSRWVCGWRTMADLTGALCHAVHCRKLSGVPSPLPKDWVMQKGRPPHDGTSSLSFKVQLTQKDKFPSPPHVKNHLLLTLHRELISTEVFPRLRYGRSISETSNHHQQPGGERTEGLGGLGESLRHGAQL